MSIRSYCSNRLGGLLTRNYLRSLERGDVWSVSPRLWTAMPASARKWLEYRVFNTAGDFAQLLLEGDRELDRLNLYPPNPYSLSPITRVVLHGILKRVKPRRVIELGSGVSTLISAAYFARQGLRDEMPAVVSVDHDLSWLEQTRKVLGAAGLSEWVRMIHAPLGTSERSGADSVTYGIPEDVLAEAAGGDGFDLCLIDGPPVQIGRGPCLPILAPYLAGGATVLLDDGIRSDEQLIWNDWCRRFPTNLVRSQYYVTDRGLLSGRWLKTPNTTLPHINDHSLIRVNLISR